MPLPDFCKEFFRGIEPTTSSRTRIAYAYDLKIFFHFLQEKYPSIEEGSLKTWPVTVLDKVTLTQLLFFGENTKQNLYISFSLCHRQILLSLVLRSSDFWAFNLGQGSLNCWFFGSVYTLPVLAIYRWHSRRKRVFKKDPSINKVLREEKEDIEALKYDASMILWYSKI